MPGYPGTMIQNTIVFNASADCPLIVNVKDNDIRTAQVYLGDRQIGYITHLDTLRKNAAFLYPSASKTDEEAIAAFKSAGFNVSVEVLSDA